MANSDPFERHGIDHLSPSSLRLWRDEPSAWIGKYLLKAPDEAGPGAWRGLAVEAGVDRLLFGDDEKLACVVMLNRWHDQAQGQIDPGAEKEQDALPGFFTQAQLAFAEKSVPLLRQAKMELTIPGISVPLVGYADWLWPDHGDDLKTTWRIPGQPDPSHVSQVAAYSMHFGVPFHLTYVSPKRWTRFEIMRPDLEAGWERVIETAHAIRSMLAHVTDGHDALSMFSPDYTSFYFRPPMAEAVRASKAARIVPGERAHQPLQAVEGDHGQ